MKHLIQLLTVLALFVASLGVVAEDQPQKEAIYTSEDQKKQFLSYGFGYAPAMRAGDYVYVSGIPAGQSPREKDQAYTRDAYKQSIDQAFKQLEATLKAAGGSLDSVVHIRSFHVFDSKVLEMSRQEHIGIFSEVKSKYIKEPFSGWTAVGTPGIYNPYGLAEFEVVAYIPQKHTQPH